MLRSEVLLNWSVRLISIVSFLFFLVSFHMFRYDFIGAVIAGSSFVFSSMFLYILFYSDDVFSLKKSKDLRLGFSYLIPYFVLTYYIISGYGGVEKFLIFALSIIVFYLVIVYLLFLIYGEKLNGIKLVFVFLVLVLFAGIKLFLMFFSLLEEFYFLLIIVSLLLFLLFILSLDFVSNIFNIGKFILMVILFLLSSLLFLSLVLGSFTLVFLILLSVLAVLVFLFNELGNFRLLLYYVFLWGIVIFFSVVIQSDIQSNILQMSVFSIFSMLLLTIFFWYISRIYFSYSSLIRDIDNFVKNFSLYTPREFEDYKIFITRIFNMLSQNIKISIVPQNVLPSFVLFKMLERRSISINDVVNSDRETISFFVTNNIVSIYRISNEISEVDYLLVKLPKVMKSFRLYPHVDKVIKDFLPILDELEMTISGLLALPFVREVESKREFRAREIESFEGVRYFLIKDQDVFFYKDKVVAYRYNEDVENRRGFYFDVGIGINRFIAFLFFVPDRLFLSNFFLLGIKGMVKSYLIEEITHEKLENLAKDFLKEKDLPLQVSVSSFEILEDSLVVNASSYVNLYVYLNGVLKKIQGKEYLSRDSVIFISNRDIIEDVILDVKFDGDKVAFIKSVLDKIKENDTFFLVCV
ncbi:MAG: hypothetical protein ACK4F9_03185 [Brevinematia bacterium]